MTIPLITESDCPPYLTMVRAGGVKSALERTKQVMEDTKKRAVVWSNPFSPPVEWEKEKRLRDAYNAAAIISQDIKTPTIPGNDLIAAIEFKRKGASRPKIGFSNRKSLENPLRWVDMQRQHYIDALSRLCSWGRVCIFHGRENLLEGERIAPHRDENTKKPTDTAKMFGGKTITIIFSRHGTGTVTYDEVPLLPFLPVFFPRRADQDKLHQVGSCQALIYGGTSWKNQSLWHSGPENRIAEDGRPRVIDIYDLIL